jgi:1-acyl-sn-glycerol-3-phosphate acyltransferase
MVDPVHASASCPPLDRASLNRRSRKAAGAAAGAWLPPWSRLAPGPAGGTWRPGFAALRAPLPLLAGWHRRAFCRLIVATLGRLAEVEGAERLAALPEPVIFACNHSNALEALLVPALLIYLRRGRAVHFLADWMVLHLPLLGRLLRLGEPIPVYAKRARCGWRDAWRRRQLREPGRSAVERCLARLAAGGSVGLFPEGTRNPRPDRLLRGRPGIGALALRSGAAVVPLGIRFPAAARLGRAPLLGRLVVRCGEPLRPSAGRPRDATREVMAALAELSGKAPNLDPPRARPPATQAAPVRGGKP